jgi:predicted permease
VLLFTLMVAVLTGLLFVLPSAWNACAAAPATTLRAAHGPGGAGLRRVFGQSFVVAQVAVSMVLVTAAALFVGHLVDLRSVERLGFKRDSVLLVTLDPRNSGYQPAQLLQLYQDLLARLETLPTVRSATLSAITPIEGGAWAQFVRVDGFDERPEDKRYVSVNAVGPKYFETMATPLMAGRDFRLEDRRGPPVAIINQAMARYYFPGRNPLGGHVSFDPGAISYEIVGVAGDAKYAQLHEPIPRTLYLNAFQDERARFSRLALRTTVSPTAIAGDVRRAAEDILKGVPVSRVTTLADQVDAAMRPERTIARLSGLFGAVAALLAAIGLYGLLSYTVARRVREIGIRMALGATRRDVSGLVLTSTLRLVAAGLVIGGPIALASRPLAAKLVIDLAPGSIMPAAAAAVMMIGVALLAAYIPARRASRVDPMVALRHE